MSLFHILVCDLAYAQKPDSREFSISLPAFCDHLDFYSSDLAALSIMDAISRFSSCAMDGNKRFLA